MTEGSSLVITLFAPVVGQFDHGAVFFLVVADKGEGKFPIREVPLAQELHAQTVAVELERLVEVVDADHRMEQAHRSSPCGRDSGAATIVIMRAISRDSARRVNRGAREG